MEILTRADFIEKVTKLVDKEAISALTDLYLKSLEIKDSEKATEKPKAESKTRKVRKSSKRVISIGDNQSCVSLDKICKKLERIVKKHDESEKQNIAISTKKEKKSFELKSSVANELIRKYAVKCNDYTMKRYYIVNRISYRLKIANTIKIKTLTCALNLKAGSYEIESYYDKNGNHTVLKGFF